VTKSSIASAHGLVRPESLLYGSLSHQVTISLHFEAGAPSWDSLGEGPSKMLLFQSASMGRMLQWPRPPYAKAQKYRSLSSFPCVHLRGHSVMRPLRITWSTRSTSAREESACTVNDR
jgi:hypothetical protein